MPIVEIPGKGEVEFPDNMSNEDIAAAIEGMVNPAPSSARVAANAANKAIAGIPDALLNTPANVINLLKAGLGTAATAAGRVDLAPDISPPPNIVRGLFERAGLISDAQEPKTAKQRVLDAVVQGGVSAMVNPARSMPSLVSNAGTGALSGLAAQQTKELTGSDALAATAGLLTSAAMNVASDRARTKVAEAASRQKANSVRDASLAAAQKEGYVIEPSAVRPNALNNALESIAGKAATTQEAAIRNQPVTNRLAAKELNLPDDTALTPQVLSQYRDSVSAPYSEVKALSSGAADTLKKLQEARSEARIQQKYYDASLKPQALAAAKAAKAREQNLEAYLDQIATNRGRPDLVPAMKDARAKIAKSYEIEDALNLGDANVSAPEIARSLQSGSPLTGNLETIAKFAAGPGKRVTREGEAVPPPGVSQMRPIAALGGAAIGSSSGGAAAGLLGGGIPLLAGPARNLILSEAYQKLMAKPSYDPGMTNKILSKLDGNSRDEIVRALLATQGVMQ